MDYIPNVAQTLVFGFPAIPIFEAICIGQLIPILRKYLKILFSMRARLFSRGF
jgi:hypothetical protein